MPAQLRSTCDRRSALRTVLVVGRSVGATHASMQGGDGGGGGPCLYGSGWPPYFVWFIRIAWLLAGCQTSRGGSPPCPVPWRVGLLDSQGLLAACCQLPTRLTYLRTLFTLSQTVACEEKSHLRLCHRIGFEKLHVVEIDLLLPNHIFPQSATERKMDPWLGIVCAQVHRHEPC